MYQNWVNITVVILVIGEKKEKKQVVSILITAFNHTTIFFTKYSNG